MTLEGFLVAFKEVARKFRVSRYQMIRPDGNPNVCPITAVCQRRTGRSYHCHEVAAAAHDLKMDTVTTNMIIKASDHITFNSPGDPGDTQVLRNRLLDIIQEAHA